MIQRGYGCVSVSTIVIISYSNEYSLNANRKEGKKIQVKILAEISLSKKQK